MSQSQYLSGRSGERDLHAIVTVAVRGTSAAGGPRDEPGHAHVLVIDCSTSMSWPESKMRAAKLATARAIDLLPDGAAFAVVAGTAEAVPVYPDDGTMAVAGPDSRSAAHAEVHRLVAAGGTAIGSWLDLARRLFEGRDESIRHAILVTDGKNEYDGRLPLEQVLAACEERFTCDAWAIGAGWDAEELLAITGRLHGSAAAVRQDTQLLGGYEESMRSAGARSIPLIRLTVTPSPGGTVRYLRQTQPARMELTGTAVPGGSGAVAYVTRSWGDEERRYQLCVTADPEGRPQEEELQAAMVDAAADGGVPRPADPVPVLVQWTDDPVAQTRIDEEVDFFDQEQALGDAIGRAQAAHRSGDTRRAVVQLGAAKNIAERINAVQPLELLNEMVAADLERGEFRALRDLSDVDFQYLTLAGNRSSWHTSAEPLLDTSPETRKCPNCAQSSPARARFCNFCRQPFPEPS